MGRGEVDQDSSFPIFVGPSFDAGFLACTPHPDGLHLNVTREVGWGGWGEVDQDSAFLTSVGPSSDAVFLGCTPHPDGLHLNVTHQVWWGGVKWIKIHHS